MNWNICEDQYPGPAIVGIDLFLPEGGGYRIDHQGSASTFQGTVSSLPVTSDPAIHDLINKWTCVWSRDLLIYEGYLTAVELESGFFNGKTEIKITVTSKQVDLSYG